MGAPTVVLRDPILIKQILVRDFDHFTDRQKTHDFEIDRLFSKSVVFLAGNKWRDMRNMLSLIYTSSKMKYMYNLMIECVEDFTKIYLKKAEENNGELEIDTHDVFGRITAEGIATTALGFKGDCLANENSKFYKVALDMEADFANPKAILLMHIFPSLLISWATNFPKKRS